MAVTRVFNITHRDEVDNPPRAYIVARQTIRPGKFIEIDDSLLSAKELALHGKALWIGERLPAELRRVSVRSIVPMTKEEAQKYLSGLSVEELTELNSFLTPVPALPARASAAFRAKVMLAALFSGQHQPDPEKFFWLRRWKKEDGNFVEV